MGCNGNQECDDVDVFGMVDLPSINMAIQTGKVMTNQWMWHPKLMAP